MHRHAQNDFPVIRPRILENDFDLIDNNINLINILDGYIHPINLRNSIDELNRMQLENYGRIERIPQVENFLDTWFKTLSDAINYLINLPWWISLTFTFASFGTIVLMNYMQKNSGMTTPDLLFKGASLINDLSGNNNHQHIKDKIATYSIPLALLGIVSKGFLKLKK